jgi:hypothetical protein
VVDFKSLMDSQKYVFFKSLMNLIFTFVLRNKRNRFLFLKCESKKHVLGGDIT